MKKKRYSLFVLGILFVLLVTACANQPVATSEPQSAPEFSASGIIAEGNLKPERAVNLSFQATGVVEEVSARIGDTVASGDVLARLSNASQVEAQLAAARLELVIARQELDTLNRTGGENLAAAWAAYMDAQAVRADAEREWEDFNVDDIDDRIEDAETEIRERQEDLEEAQEEFAKYQDLDEDNSTRQTAEDDLETAQEDYNEAVRELEELTRERDVIRAALDAALAAEAEAVHQYERSTEGVNADQLALAQAKLENAEAQVAAAQANLSSYVLTAPFDGVVAEVAVRVGEQVMPDSRAVSVADPSAWMVETTDITELEVVEIAEGQNVTFTADALPDVIMEGTVSEISQAAYTQGGDVIYTVRIAVNEVDPRVRWGMTVEVIFDGSEN
ncbi:MAG TPA: efflux RND transporter periplasmic adaptor subunit [Anaerolineales bacterium]|nr:efflux RND transporter periplasmic adaptor subunit [Anaerolineales bacterium]